MSRVFFYFCLVIFLVDIYVFPLNTEIKIYDLIKDGQKYSYNFEIEKAIKIFDEVISKYPDDPRGYHYKSVVYMWYYLGNNEDINYDGFIKYSDLAINKIEAVLDKNSKDEEALLLMGSNYGYRAIAFGKAGKHLNMIWASQKSNSFLNQVISLNPTKYDAYLGLGLFKFALSQVPSSFKWALNMIGYDGDQAKGLKYLQIAAEKGENSRVEAQYYLSQIYSEFLFENNKASGLLKELISKYSNNVLFQYSYAVVCIKQRKLNEAEKELKLVLGNVDNSFTQIFAFSNFLLGDIKLREGQYERAVEYYSSFINSKTPSDYKGIASYRGAIASAFLNRDEDYKRYLIESQKGNQALDDDVFAKRRSKVFINKGSINEELRIIKYYNYFLSGKENQSIDSLSNFLKTVKNPENRAEILNYLAEISIEKKDYESAIEYALQSLSIEIKVETWIKPFSTYYLALSNYNLKKMKQAVEYLDEVEDFDDYDYRSKLLSLVASLKNKISS